MNTNGKILIVDDDLSLRESLSQFFESEGWVTELCSNSSAALSALGIERWDVALIDIGLPEMDGIELLDRIRSSWPGTEVVVMTGHASVETAVRTLTGGARDYIEKPFQLDELSRRVDRILNLARSQREFAAIPTLKEVERRHIQKTVERSKRNLSQAARLLGIDRTTLYNKLKKYGLR